MLKLEPCWGALSVDDVMRVAEPERDNGEQVLYHKLHKEAIFKVFQNWEQRKLITLNVDKLGGKFEVRYASHASEVLEKEVLRDAGAAPS